MISSKSMTFKLDELSQVRLLDFQVLNQIQLCKNRVNRHGYGVNSLDQARLQFHCLLYLRCGGKLLLNYVL